MAYARYDVSGYHGVYVEHVNGSGRPKRLTHMEGDGNPAWSPSGRRLVFTREDDEGFRDLWIHYARGNRFLTRGDEADWSVSGEIAFTGSTTGARGIWAIRSDGSGLRRLTTRWALSPDWSPDGRRIVFASGCCRGDISTVRADGSGFHQLTRGPAWDSSPAFSPDGRHIAFVRLSLRGQSGVMTMTTSGRHLTVVAGGSPWLYGGLEWQPL